MWTSFEGITYPNDYMQLLITGVLLISTKIKEKKTPFNIIQLNENSSRTSNFVIYYLSTRYLIVMFTRQFSDLKITLLLSGCHRVQ